MNHWVALLRGINVGGHNRLPMKDLAELLENWGCCDVSTYIQSGNVVFSHAESSAQKLARGIGARIEEQFGFAPAVHLMTVADLEECVARNPFGEAEQDHKSLHLTFLSQPAVKADIETMTALSSGGEKFELTEKVFYLFAPNGIGRSRLAAKVEKLLGVSTTARNWRTVNKLLELAHG
ncbi:MAG: DUF1697 domain-containing protein [Woeseiaceae bacterium]